ncbi:hypothetical protein ACLOAV_010267 [Pseudogymnoascus australis]
MDEKHPSVQECTGPLPRVKQKRRLAYFAVAAITLYLVSWRVTSFGVQACKHHDELLSDTGEHIKWKPCGQINDHKVKCSDVDVPMDQFDSQNSGGNTFNIPLIRLRGKNASQNLLLNPGGPGGSENFHLLSFDPRGVNSSRPLASCYPDQKTRDAMSESKDADPVKDSPYRYAWTKNYIKGCLENMGEHGKYINTPQTAADMNSILDAVGQEKMVYWGFSYGSLLGQTYAALFPERSHRVIIDGVVDFFEWSLKAPMLKSDFTDTQHVLDGFFDECIKAGDKCALSSLGGSKSELERRVLSFLEGLKQDPVAVHHSATTYGILDHKAMLYGVFRHLYAPKTWYQFANRLAQMIDGNATDAFLAYGFGESSTFQPIGEATDIVEFNDGATGPKHWPQGRDKLQDLIFPYYESSAFAYSHNKANYVRQTWPVPKTHNFAPQND